jgi:hypothetical protein
MEDIQAALGIEVGEFWGAFRNHVPQVERRIKRMARAAMLEFRQQPCQKFT